MSLTARLKQDMQSALRAGDKARLSVLRLAVAAVTQREVDTRQTQDDASVQSLLERMIKQGRDALQQYRDAGRDDLADKEAAEIEILQSYLPEPLSDAQLDSLLAEVVEATGAKSLKDMGKVMGAVKARAAGRVDMGAVNTRARALLEAE